MNVVRKFNTDTASQLKSVEFISLKDASLEYDMEKNVFKQLPKGDVVITVKEDAVIMHKDVKKFAKKGAYTFFDFLCSAMFQNNASAMLNYVIYDAYGEDIPFICVGTDYFKVIETVDRYSVKRRKLKLWKLSEIKPFFGKEVIFKIPRYDDFCLVPDNINHRPIINNMYNQHSPFSHEPSMYGGATPWTTQLMEHIFGDQVEQGMTYLQCLYKYPKQALPILVLVSEERQTGKSTFVDWLSIMFGDNMVIANPEDIGSSFNSSYSDKNIIAIEESRFDSVQTTEKLKNLATQKKILVNAKHQQPYSLPFFGKLIITSNDERKFSKVDQKEIRYWVRKVPTLEGKANHNILNDLMEEIPDFLYNLLQLEDPDFSKSRMVFDEDDIRTDALQTVKRESRSQLEKDLLEYFSDLFFNNQDLDELRFIPKDIKERWFKHESRYSVSYLRTVLETNFGLPKEEKVVRYHVLDDGQVGIGGAPKRAGQPFVLNRDFFEEISSAQVNVTEVDDKEEIPF